MFSRQDDGQYDLFKMCHYVVQNLKKVDAFYRTQFNEKSRSLQNLPAVLSKADEENNYGLEQRVGLNFNLLKAQRKLAESSNGFNPVMRDSFTDFTSLRSISRAQSRQKYEDSFEFQRQVRNCISQLDKMPKLKEKISEKLNQVDMDYSYQDGKRGQLEGEKTRKRLLAQARYEKKVNQESLDQMIQLTAQTNVMHAIRLNGLLQPNWTEEPNSYKIMSRITTAKQKKRL